MVSTGANERRRGQRVAWDGSASVDGAGVRFRGLGIDLSASGAAVRCTGPAMLGDLVSLRLALDSTVITMRGFVVSSVSRGAWHRNSVQFTAGHPQCHRAIERFVRTRATQRWANGKIPPPPAIPPWATGGSRTS